MVHGAVGAVVPYCVQEDQRRRRRRLRRRAGGRRFTAHLPRYDLPHERAQHPAIK